MAPDKSKEYVQYAYNILEDKIPACVHVKNACRRFINDFSRTDLQFNYAKVDRIIQFTQLLKHHDAPPGIVGTPLYLSDWQMFIVANIFGWEYKETKVRRYTRSYVEIGRKNCKSQLASALSMFSLLEYMSGNQILLCANTREQAGRLFDFCKAFAKNLDPTEKSLKILRDRIVLKETGGYVLVMSSDSKTGDGYCPYFAVVDELHAAPDSGTVDVIRSGMSKPGAHLAMITTAGFDSHSYCHSVRDIVADILSGKKQDDRFFGIIYTIDEEDDWKDRNVWIKASPNIGKSVPYSFYEDCLTAALNSPSDELNFKTKNLNIWGSDAANIWIPNAYIEKCVGNVDFTETAGDFVTIGVDLSAVRDMTAVSYLYYKQKEKKLMFDVHYYLPETCLQDSENKEFYNRMYRENRLFLTPGNVVDYDKIADDIIQHQQKYQYTCLGVGYDSWNATQFAITLTNRQLTMHPVSQTVGASNQVVKELERRIYTEQIILPDNPIVSWNFQNAVLRVDGNGNTRPTKCVNTKGNAVGMRKIDGIIAMMNALTILMQEAPVVFLEEESEE